MATYLITGVAGFIGSALARAVLAQGDKVRGLDNFSSGKHENLEEIIKRIDFREGDVLDLEAVHEACQGVDYVMHQAAIPSVPNQLTILWEITPPTSTARSMFWSPRAMPRSSA